MKSDILYHMNYLKMPGIKSSKAYECLELPRTVEPQVLRLYWRKGVVKLTVIGVWIY